VLKKFLLIGCLEKLIHELVGMLSCFAEIFKIDFSGLAFVLAHNYLSQLEEESLLL
jgi:hypothetical protein